jgi:hypothetical protein
MRGAAKGPPLFTIQQVFAISIPEVVSKAQSKVVFYSCAVIMAFFKTPLLCTNV